MRLVSWVDGYARNCVSAVVRVENARAVWPSCGFVRMWRKASEARRVPRGVVREVVINVSDAPRKLVLWTRGEWGV